jgi:hypothetical protein
MALRAASKAMVKNAKRKKGNLANERLISA